MSSFELGVYSDMAEVCFSSLFFLLVSGVSYSYWHAHDEDDDDEDDDVDVDTLVS